MKGPGPHPDLLKQSLHFDKAARWAISVHQARESLPDGPVLLTQGQFRCLTVCVSGWDAVALPADWSVALGVGGWGPSS